MGINTVAVYSEADEYALHVHLADEAIDIGPAPASESYLVHDNIIRAAQESGADAIHPGYGFLSENHEFNKKVRDAGLIFIGPEPEAMRVLGSKVESRIKMMESGVPVVPGMKSSEKNIDEFIKTANEIGYPVLIKASAGGGGKGMRIVKSPEDIEEAVNSAMRESQSAFGSDEIFLEKYIESPRHIEIQVARDHHGNAVHFFERECSIQRRHQKVIEETPSTALTDEKRKEMGEAAIKAVEAVNYDSVATVEFLFDKDSNFYFLEVNTRIQVEHPITELVTNVDLVKLQIRIAEGNEIGIKQEEIIQNGHALECRLYAEDPENNFMPSTGKIHFLSEPIGNGVRIDSGIKEGDEISVYYDPIMSKLITWGRNREESISRMDNALRNYVILGVKNPIPFMLKVIRDQDFIDGNTLTDFIDKKPSLLEIDRNEFLNEIAYIASQVNNLKEQKISFNKNSDVWQEIGNWEICTGK